MSRRTSEKKRGAGSAPSPPAMEAAVRGFLVAAGLDPVEHPELSQTPRWVARAWAEEFLDGYGTDPRVVLADRLPATPSKGNELVVLTRLVFQSVCPHHLLPYGGVAHVAYVPSRQIVGFGQIGQLVSCLSHRLVLQEELARQIVRNLVSELRARGAGVVLEAEQSCLKLRGERQSHSRVMVEAWEGSMATEASLRERFFSMIYGGNCSSTGRRKSGRP